MAITFNELLRDVGLKPSDIRLVRHADPKRATIGRSPYELWRSHRDKFEIYQRTQKIQDRSRLNGPYWAVFVATPGKETMFVGIYGVEYLGVSKEKTPAVQISDDTWREAGERDVYKLELLDELSDLIGELIIDWGPGFKAWIQRAENQDKKIVRPLATQIRQPAAKPTIVDDIKEIESQTKDTTTRKTLVDARLGQGKFRGQVLQLWGNCCSVTESKTQDAIRASHIKPWRDSNNEERLDPNNGLPLVAGLDALFDAGLISFASSGAMLVSSELNKHERQIFGVDGESLVKKPTTKTAAYLAYHRDNCFQK